MADAHLKKLRSGKVAVTLAANGHDVIRIPDRNISPYQPGSSRERAWHVVRLMDGLTVRQAHEVLAKLEPGIQGQVGRPIGWLANAVNSGYAKIEAGIQPTCRSVAPTHRCKYCGEKICGV